MPTSPDNPPPLTPPLTRPLPRPAALPAPRTDWVLYLIAADKLVKGLFVFILGIEALRLIHQNLHDTVVTWAHHLHVAPGNRYLQDLLTHTLNVSPATLRVLGFGFFLYAALYLVEGLGLAFRKVWAEWVVVISTTLFVPIEIYEIAHHFRWLKVVVLLVNILIVLYLLYRLGREHRAHQAPPPPAS
jgi:uncharacterized membrane protein (DUF2068 family)